ncbi:MAG: HNH endonuclease, partial [Bdellovibrionales bacterium]|nr:HNH endonuclease [Bdellovibrionales bacterium]
ELAINNLEKSVPYKTTKTKDSDRKDRSELISKDLDKKDSRDDRVGRNQDKKESDIKVIQPKNKNPRYISKKLKYHIWQRDDGQCTKCGSRQHLHIDHVKPVALGGEANTENLRLLCQPCNQRQAIRIFGLN